MRFCIASIWPVWAWSWIRCGSPMRDGRCVRYGHSEQGCEPPPNVRAIRSGRHLRSATGPTGATERFDHPCHAGDFGQPCGDAGSSATPNVVVPADLFAEVIDSLEQCDCQFWACKGETLTPIDMVTCHRCATLARLRTLATAPNSTGGEA